uniref:Uncharacterized protein n=1 Tax=Arundo donax TaxID=35708 RepID=A0A0A9BT34_ARUDO
MFTLPFLACPRSHMWMQFIPIIWIYVDSIVKYVIFLKCCMF